MSRLPGFQAARKLHERVHLFDLVQVSQERSNSGIGFFEVVMRNSREEVMNDMSSDVMMEMLEQTVHTIDRLEVTLDIVPIFCVVPFRAGLCMVKKGDN